jgi:cysteine desulfurase / selenocysteine lyase
MVFQSPTIAYLCRQAAAEEGCAPAAPQGDKHQKTTQMPFDKSAALFSASQNMSFLGHCSISPLYGPAAELAVELIREQQHHAGLHFVSTYLEQLEQLKIHTAALLRTQPEHIAVVKNTSEAISMIANGYPFEPGDEVISYVHEYPANHYPWRLQERRGVKLKLLSNVPARADINPELPGGWSMTELEALITPRTRIIALSHVQFTSGYAADLRALGQLCRERGIDLVIDAAQSLGSMPIFPEEMNIAALASAGWKWLLGPFGTGVFYTSAPFRDRLAPMQVGAEAMQQGFDYLDHTWNPHTTAKRFEYSSSPISLVAALAKAIGEVHARYGAEAIFQEILRLQDVFLGALHNPALHPLVFEGPHRSGILSIVGPDLKALNQSLLDANIACALRSGFLRVAPHFYNTDEEMLRLAEALS